jgi:hypothetical protein
MPKSFINYSENPVRSTSFRTDGNNRLARFGTVWEGQDTYKTLDEAFQDLEAGLGTGRREEEIE